MAPSKELVAAGSGVSAAIKPIDPNQTLKASKALLAHIRKAAALSAEKSATKNLLADGDGDVSETPIWLTLTTKRHIADRARLQPGRIPVPHPLDAAVAASPSSVCLITADPQRAYKDIVAADDFPAALRARVTRVVGVSKLRAKYGQFEAQRRLFTEHDVFLADDRIINRLPKLLGKTFYKTTQKRPVPVVLQARGPKVDGKRAKPGPRAEGEVNAGSPAQLAREIEKALSCALVSLSPSTNTAIRVGYAGWPAEHIAANVDAVAGALVDKWVPQKWRNVRGIYIKGPDSAALPIWLTDELWASEADVVADGDARALGAGEKANVGKKRKALAATDEKEEEPEPSPPAKKQRKSKRQAAAAAAAVPDGDDGDLDAQIADRKARLRKQKAAARKLADDV